MAVTIDLTQGEYTSFSGSTEEDINYAKTFWQSVHLQPPVESRLVSSDIKQRLKIAPSAGSIKSQQVHMWNDESKEERATREFLMRAKTMEKLEEYGRMQKFARAMEEDKELVRKHREERIKKEEISRGKGLGKKKVKEAFVENDIDNPQEETSEEALKQLDEFDKNKYGADSDSD